MSELVRDTQIRIGVEDSRPLVVDVGGAPDRVFGVLADERRLRTLAVLRDASASMDLSTLARRVADGLDTAPSDSPPPATPRRLRVSLHHQHLPVMAAAGLVEYDSEAHTVEGTDAIQG